MPDAPFFSIVIPTFNRADLIARTLDSVLCQTFTDFEVIVVDDGGADGTEAIVRAIDHRAVTYHWKTHGERGAARNAGASLARGRYVNFLDSDDLLYPNHLAVAAEFIRAHDEPEVCHFAYDIKDENLKIVRGATVFTGDLNEQIALGSVLHFNAAFLRRDIALEHPFSEDPELTGEDWHLWLRLGARFPLVYSNVVTSSVINHQSRSVLTMDQGTLIRRTTRLLECLLDDEEVRRRYGRYESRMRAGMYCYLALHLALGRLSRRESARYLGMAVTTWPPVVTRRAFYGALKRLIMPGAVGR